MKAAAEAEVSVRLCMIMLANWAVSCHGALRVGFYQGKCGIADVEATVAGVVTGQFLKDPTTIASLLRIQFHDCIVGGCDASLLLDGMKSEKRATPNLRLKGYNIIDEAKAAVERLCPGVVSCADLITIATRDAVFLGGGGRYEVQTGRRDSLASAAQNLCSTIPSPSISVSDSIKLFADKGLTPTDMVLLLGAHSVGTVYCSSIKDQLYNTKIRGRAGADPSMDHLLVNELRSRCPQNATTDNRVNLDQSSDVFGQLTIDTAYYRQLMCYRGVLKFEQELTLHPVTRPLVANLANALDFPARFGAAMVRLGAVGVLTGTKGEIRRSCRVPNTPQFP